MTREIVIERMKSGDYGPGTLVWSPGMQNWLPANAIDELRPKVWDLEDMQAAMELASEGNQLGSEGRMDAAIACFREAIKLNWDWVPAYVSLSIALRETGQFDEAIKVLDRTPIKARLLGDVVLDCSHMIFNAKAAVYLKKGDKQKAVEFLEKALDAAQDPTMKEHAAFSHRIGMDPGPLGDPEKMIPLIEGLLSELREGSEIVPQPTVSWTREGDSTIETGSRPTSVSQHGPSKQVNGYALAGLILAIVAVFLYFIGIIPILAVVFSAIGLAKAKERGSKGRVQAWIGLVLGSLYTLAYLYHYGHLR